MKKIISTVLVLVMFLSTTCVSVFASDYSSYRKSVDKLNSMNVPIYGQRYRVIKSGDKYVSSDTNGTGGICNIVSVTQLLNRRIAFDTEGNFTSNDLFTIEQSIEANGCKISEREVPYRNGNTGYVFSGGTGSWYVKTYSKGNFKYKMTYKNTDSVKADMKSKGISNFEDYLAKILIDHPEGVVYRKNGRCMVITDYKYNDNKYTFYGIDGVNKNNPSSYKQGIVEFSETYQCKANGVKTIKDNAGLLAYIDFEKSIIPCPPAGKNSQGEYSYETYKNGSTTVFGACKQCHKPYNWQTSFKKKNSTVYEIKSSSKNYVVKVRSLPYDGAPVLFDKVSKTFTVIGEVTNAYGSKWYAIDFQDDAKKQCYTAYVYGGQIDEHYNSTTTEIKAKEYKSANVVTHKHDYTYGNGKCYCGETKVVEVEKSSLNINLTSYPTSIKQGSSFGLRGTISSNYNIKRVNGYIKQGDTVYASSEDTPNKKKLDVKTAALNKNLIFGKLPVGNYSLCVEAVDTSGQTVRINKNFSVYEEQKKDASTLSINLERYPVSINLGSLFSVRGNITSNYSISKVKGYIYDANGSVVQSTTDTPNSTYMEIRPANLNQKLIFGKLSSGNYTMKVEAVDASGKVVTATKNFTVKGGGNTPSGAPIKFEIETVPKGNMPYGKDFTLKGWFRSDSAIAETRAYILDENKNVVMQSDSASSTTSNYKIEGYKLDKGIKFDQLSPGGYYLKYYVRDADGDTSTWMSDKFYIVKENTSSGSSPSSPSTNTSQTTSIRFEIESMPKGNLPYGKSFSLKGWFRSDSPIVEARAYMLDANKNIVMQSDPASSTTSNYKIQGYKLDKAMKFDKLSPGGYYLKFFVRDANGDTFTWVSDKFYIVK